MARLQQQVKELQEKLSGLQQKLAAREGALSGLQAAHSETLERLASAQVNAHVLDAPTHSQGL